VAEKRYRKLVRKVFDLKKAEQAAAEIVYYVKAHVEGGCPECGDNDCPVVSRKKGSKVRQHKCSNGHYFKSVQK